MSHIHNVVDTDVHYKIDGITRTVTNINETKRQLVQNDHNSERLTFEIPRYVDGHDFSQCNDVQVHYDNLDKFDKIKGSGVYPVDDLHIKEDDDSSIILSWLISSNATRYVGTLNFSIRFACTDNGKIEYAWNTTVFKGISILESLNNSDTVVASEADALVALRNELMTANVPKVTEADNGKILRVVDGVWTAVELQGVEPIPSAEGVSF